MFCDEPIVRVYLSEDEYEGAAAWLDCYHDLAYHVTEGCRMVLETENWTITLDVNGVSKEPKESFHARPGEELQDGIASIDPDDTPYILFETTLFVGERLRKVSKSGNLSFCEFDDFTLKVIPYELDTMDKYLCREDRDSYNYILGCDRHLKRKCDCGGNGEILLDFVSDYIVRCKVCNKSTWANMELQAAIDDWNRGDVPCMADDVTIE